MFNAYFKSMPNHAAEFKVFSNLQENILTNNRTHFQQLQRRQGNVLCEFYNILFAPERQTNTQGSEKVVWLDDLNLNSENFLSFEKY